MIRLRRIGIRSFFHRADRKPHADEGGDRADSGHLRTAGHGLTRTGRNTAQTTQLMMIRAAALMWRDVTMSRSAHRGIIMAGESSS